MFMAESPLTMLAFASPLLSLFPWPPCITTSLHRYSGSGGYPKEKSLLLQISGHQHTFPQAPICNYRTILDLLMGGQDVLLDVLSEAVCKPPGSPNLVDSRVHLHFAFLFRLLGYTVSRLLSDIDLFYPR